MFKPKGKGLAVIAVAPVPLKVVHPKVLCHNQYGQDLTQKVSVPFDSTSKAAISTIQAIFGSLKLPAGKCPPLIVKLNKNSTLRLVLGTAQDWEQLKVDWLTDFSKKKAPIEVSVTASKKMLKNIEEAVRVSIGKSKKPVKKAENPYLSLDSEDGNGGPSDGKDLKIEHSDNYKR
ncbi:hypothetical protein K439DRAFT_1615698 [Ramaria rubella]|nr:hypothetical protein K439DRAFT_1615698 [Ramaria rubella]